MKYTCEQMFSDLKHKCLGWTYKNFDELLKGLMYGMRDKIGHPFTKEEYRNLRFVMNLPFYHEFSIACKRWWDQDSYMYRGITISPDPSLYIGNTQSPDGIVRLIYEEAKTYNYKFSTAIINRHHNDYMDCLRYCMNRFETKEEKKMVPEDYKETTVKFCFDNSILHPHIDHVIFNGPATIVFWKDKTKTVVKLDERYVDDRRKAILYAFIRKIYGEGRPYHDILNEIEWALEEETDG